MKGSRVPSWPKGSRVRLVVNELRGEKIDVVQWTEDPSRFVASALAPAKVKEVVCLGPWSGKLFKS